MKDDEDDDDEKELSQRDKNREAVRNCRKRKKEHVQQLNERIQELVAENAKLRLELKLGGENHYHEDTSLVDEKDLVQEMEEILSNVDQSKLDVDVILKRKVHTYMQRHQDHGRDRQKAMSFVLSHLYRLVEPDNITKQYLHMMTCGAGFEAEKYKSLRELLNLSPEQQEEFLARTTYAKRLRTELECAIEKTGSIIERCHQNKKVGDSLHELTTVLKPGQFARFVVWVHSNPACKDILDELWCKLLERCDIQINNELSASKEYVTRIKRFQENSAAIAVHLFSVPDPEARYRLARICLHPNINLSDPNNCVDKRGVLEVARYMAMVVKAFDTQSCEKTRGTRVLNVTEVSITSDRADDKVTGTWKLSGAYIGRLRPLEGQPGYMLSPSMPFGSPSTVDSNFALPKAVGGVQKQSRSPILSKEEQKEREVSFNVIVEFTFSDPNQPDLITEMLISWDAMSLIGQLGLLAPKVEEISPPAQQPPVALKLEIPIKEVKVEDSQTKRRHYHCLMLSTLFESGTDFKLAREILHQDVVFDDIHMGSKNKGLETSLAYIKRLHRAFPTYKIIPTLLSERETTEGLFAGTQTSEVQWQVNAMYAGSLVQVPTPCCFVGKVFITTDNQTCKIIQAKIDVAAQDLMHQLGILKS